MEDVAILPPEVENLGQTPLKARLYKKLLGNELPATKGSQRKRMRRPRIGLVIMLIFVQNILIFSQHWQGKAFFPADFGKTYYAYVAFWTTVVREGIVPHWMPFQNLGYPFVAAIQSGFFYPLFWIFTLSQYFPYSTDAAVIFQCCHILFGSIGFFLFVDLICKYRVAALVGAVAFQFFGGFYSNAEHPDIIRAYSWLPWLFYVTQIDFEENRISKRNYCIPLVFYCFITGSYPGNIFSQLSVLGGVRLFELISNQLSRSKKLLICALWFLGISSALNYLFPVYSIRNLLLRIQDFKTLSRMNWSILQWPTLFMNWTNDGYKFDVSMVSCFITVPMVVLWGLLDIQIIKKYWIWMFALILSLFMAAGSESPVYRGITQFLPFLSYSRFPSSDYRGLVGFLLLVFSALFLDQFLKNSHLKGLIWRLWSIPSLVLIGYLTRAFSVAHIAREFVCTGVIAIGSICVVYYFRGKTAKIIGGLVAFVLISGCYVLSLSKETWVVNGSLNDIYKKNMHVDTLKSLPLVSILNSPPKLRSERKIYADPEGLSWRGFLTGEYVFGGYDTSNIKQKNELLRASHLSNYMQKAWTPITVLDLAKFDCTRLAPMDQNLIKIQIKQIRYGLNEIYYQVSSPVNFTFIENEVYFPGWHGSLGAGSEIHAVEACNGLRAWHLPQGDYLFKAEFRLPAFDLGTQLSVISLLMYLFLIGMIRVYSRIKV